MSRLTVIAGICLVVAGCNDPAPPPEPQQPPALTRESAKQVLVEMLRVRPEFLRAVPFDPPDRLATEVVVVHEPGRWSIGRFVIVPADATWQFHEGVRRGCYWVVDGGFELAGDRWVARGICAMLANPGPIGRDE